MLPQNISYQIDKFVDFLIALALEGYPNIELIILKNIIKIMYYIFQNIIIVSVFPHNNVKITYVYHEQNLPLLAKDYVIIIRS